MKEAAEEFIRSFDHRVRMRTSGKAKQGEAGTQPPPQTKPGPTHAQRKWNRKANPIIATTAPPTRTVIFPHGHFTSRPHAIPLRCRSPVAVTKPIENVIALAEAGNSVPCA